MSLEFAKASPATYNCFAGGMLAEVGTGRRGAIMWTRTNFAAVMAALVAACSSSSSGTAQGKGGAGGVPEPE